MQDSFFLLLQKKNNNNNSEIVRVCVCVREKLLADRKVLASCMI